MYLAFCGIHFSLLCQPVLQSIAEAWTKNY